MLQPVPPLAARLFLLAALALPAHRVVWGEDAPATVAPPQDSFIQQVEKHFAEWDANHDGTLTLTELDAAVGNPQIQGPEGAALAALKRASRTPNYTLPPLTLASIHELNEKHKADQPDLSAMYRFGLKKLAKNNRALFVSGVPRLETIRQGKMGNCFTLAPLGALTAGRPEVVKAMFHSLEDGSYEVKMGAKAVHVAPPTDAEVAMISSTGGDGLWVNIYEKAAGQARNELRPEAQRTASALDAIAKGGSAGTMLSFITGHPITRFSCKFAKDEKLTAADRESKLIELRDLLSLAQQEGRLMTCGTVLTTTPGMTPHHAYAVLGYDAASDQIKLWNPHGDAFKPKGGTGLVNGYPRTAGVFQMPLGEFVQQFAGLAFEQAPKV